MKVYDLAVVEDRGTFWKVTNLTQNTLDNQADKNEQVVKLSYMSHQIMRDAIMAGKAVHIPKALRSVEVLPGDFEIVDLAKTDEIQEARNASIVKIRMLVTPILSKISGFALYGFMVLNNDLAHYKDEIENISHIERKFTAFRSAVQQANSVEDILALESQFLERFYAND